MKCDEEYYLSVKIENQEQLSYRLKMQREASQRMNTRTFEQWGSLEGRTIRRENEREEEKESGYKSRKEREREREIKSVAFWREICRRGEGTRERKWGRGEGTRERYCRG